MKRFEPLQSRAIFFEGYASLAALVGFTAALAACETEPARNLGQTVDGRSLAVTATPQGEPFGVPLADFAGRWLGSASDPLALGGERAAYVFPSGATSIVLDLPTTEREGRPSVTGSLCRLPKPPRRSVSRSKIVYRRVRALRRTFGRELRKSEENPR
jgi:hypothetical protein